jgi:hypothetical protein
MIGNSKRAHLFFGMIIWIKSPVGRRGEDVAVVGETMKRVGNNVVPLQVFWSHGLDAIYIYATRHNTAVVVAS